MAGKAHLLHSLHHLIAGLLLVVKGIDKISHHVFIGSLFLLFGILILSFFFYVLFKKQHAETFELTFRWFEAIVSLFTAYIFFTEGKKYLPYGSLLAAIGFLISIYMFHKQKRAKAKH